MPDQDRSLDSAAWIEVNPERLEQVRKFTARAAGLAEQWLEGAYMRNEDRAIKDAFAELHMLTTVAAQEASLLTYREAEPTEWERLLADPTQQFDKEGVVLRSVLAHQRAACQHKDETTYPPATIGGTPVTVCNVCGVYR